MLRSWQIWFGAFVLSTILIGIYFDRDRAPSKKMDTKGNGNVIGPYRFCTNTRCSEHQRLRKTERLACWSCRHPLAEPTLEDLGEMQLPEEGTANLELAKRYFDLMQRCNKYLEQSDALTMLALEDKYAAQIFMENAQTPSPHRPMRTQEKECTSEQATVETLPVAEFNVFLRYEREKWNALPAEDR